MIYKKRTSLLSVKMIPTITNYVNNRSLWCSSFICYNNENGLINGRRIAGTTMLMFTPLWLFAKVESVVHVKTSNINGRAQTDWWQVWHPNLSDEPTVINEVTTTFREHYQYEGASAARTYMIAKEKIELPPVPPGKRYQQYKFVKNCENIKYGCCICLKLFGSHGLVTAHYNYSHGPGKQSSEEQTSHPFSTPLAPIENTVVSPRKRRTTRTEGVSHLLGSENQMTEVLSAVLNTSKLATGWINIATEDENEDVYLMSSPKELLKLDKFEDKLVKVMAGICLNNETATPMSKRVSLPDDYLHQTLHNSEAYSFMLKLDSYSKVTRDERTLLNKDWLSHDEIRLACAQLLGGAILVDAEQILFINTVEVYARSSTLDVHHERLDPLTTFSSLPTPAHPYRNVSVSLYDDDNSTKLIIGTHSFNALVTSSVRLDRQSELETGPSTKEFSPSLNTKLFIANSSREAVNEIIQTKKETLYDFDILHQLRQLRSKLTSPSTYSISRACSILTNNIACRPYTIYTIVDSGASSSDTDDMIACRMLRLIAIKILNNTTTFTKEEVDNIIALKNGDFIVLKTLKNIQSLFNDNEPLPILYNSELESLLDILANIITSKLPSYNAQVKSNFKKRMEVLKLS